MSAFQSIPIRRALAHEPPLLSRIRDRALLRLRDLEAQIDVNHYAHGLSARIDAIHAALEVLDTRVRR